MFGNYRYMTVFRFDPCDNYWVGPVLLSALTDEVQGQLTFYNMNIQKFYDEQSTYNLSPEFTAKLAEIKPVFDDYMTAQRKANHSFMLIVGELQEYRFKDG